MNIGSALNDYTQSVLSGIVPLLVVSVVVLLGVLFVYGIGRR